MKARNPMVGRHNAGSPIARSGVKPPVRTGSATGNFVGGGINRKSAASPQHSTGVPSTNNFGGSQLDSITRKSPEPFRNPNADVNLPTTTVVDSPDQKPLSGLTRSKPTLPMGAAGIVNGVGQGKNPRGQMGPNMPALSTKRTPNPYYKGPYSRGPKQSFYGR